MRYVLTNPAGEFYTPNGPTLDYSFAWSFGHSQSADEIAADEKRVHGRIWDVVLCPRDTPNSTPAFARRDAVALTVDEICRLHELREKCPTIVRFLEELLARQGDAADRELVALQHWLAERFPPAPRPPV